MSDTAPTFYRYVDEALDTMADGGVGFEDEFEIRLHRVAFVGVKRTPCGWWIRAPHYGRKRFVADLDEEAVLARRYRAPRRYAYRSDELALVSYLARKQMQRSRAIYSLRMAELGEAEAKKRLGIAPPAAPTEAAEAAQ